MFINRPVRRDIGVSVRTEFGISNWLTVLSTPALQGDDEIGSASDSGVFAFGGGDSHDQPSRIGEHWSAGPP